MTQLTFGQKSEHFMIRIDGLLIGEPVTGIAFTGGSRINIGMTGNALYAIMSSLQNKCLHMLIKGVFPAHGLDRMALLAVPGKLCRLVIGILTGGKNFQMAAIAGCRQAIESSAEEHR